jgi:hypothetical protein
MLGASDVLQLRLELAPRKTALRTAMVVVFSVLETAR